MSSRNCQYSIRRVHKTCRKYMAMSSRRETRAQEKRSSRKIGPDRLSLSPISGSSDRSRPIDLSRARRRTHGTPRTSRTSRDAYAKRDNAKTSNSELDFPVGETFGFAPPTSDTPGCDNEGAWSKHRLPRAACTRVKMAADQTSNSTAKY